MNPIDFSAKKEEDTMYFFQANPQPYKAYFSRDIIREVSGHCYNNHWHIMPREEVPEF